jgi:hypothetical protein
MISIPRFNASELKDIFQILGEEGIDFDYEGQTSSVSHYGGVTEYLLLVSNDEFEEAIEILMDYFEISAAVVAILAGQTSVQNVVFRSQLEHLPFSWSTRSINI